MTWLDDMKCLELLKTLENPRYAELFQHTKRGAYRSDLCRVAYLWQNGGFYTDVDMEMAVPFQKLIPFKSSSFFSAWTSDSNGEVLNALIGVTPRHPMACLR